MSSKGPVFVLGPPRSGTTLLANLLSNSEEMFIPMETNVFSRFWSLKISSYDVGGRLDCLLNSIAKGAPWWEDEITSINTNIRGPILQRLQGNASHKQVLTVFMEEYAKLNGKVRWGEKTPRHVYHLETIASTYPNAYFLFIFRDPRDFLSSYKRAQATSMFGNLYSPIVTTFHLREMIRRITKFTGSQAYQNTHMLHYEDLVSDPSETMRSVCQFLELTYSDTMLDTKFMNTSFPEAKQDVVGITDKQIGNWQKHLNDLELAVLSHGLHKEAGLIGYDLQSYPFTVREFLAWCRLPLSLLRIAYTKAHSQTTSTNIFSYLWKRIT